MRDEPPADYDRQEGGRIIMHDSRVSILIQWAAGIFAGLMVIVLSWVGTTLVELRQSVAVMSKQSDALGPTIQGFNTKAEAMQGQITAIQIKLGIMEARQTGQIPLERR